MRVGPHNRKILSDNRRKGTEDGAGKKNGRRVRPDDALLRRRLLPNRIFSAHNRKQRKDGHGGESKGPGMRISITRGTKKGSLQNVRKPAVGRKTKNQGAEK